MRNATKQQCIWIILLLIFITLGTIRYVRENIDEERKYRVFYLANKKSSESEDWVLKHVKGITDTTEGFSTSSTTEITSESPNESILNNTKESGDAASTSLSSTTSASKTLSERNTSVSVNDSDVEMDEDNSDRINGSNIDTGKEDVVEGDDSGRWHAEAVLRESIYRHKMENFVKPPHESCKRRLPACIVVGVAKSGTREIMDFMRLHPHIEIYYGEKTYEMPYFNSAYGRGQEWFQSQMPCSYSNQITVMKNAWYFHANYIPERIKKLNESIKLILLVREPVARAVSHFTFLHRKHHGVFSFDDAAIKDNKVNEKIPSLVRSVYDKPMENWLKYFNLDQFLIINSDELKYHPATVMTKVEDFLGLEHYITPEMFVLNKNKGFYCIKSDLTISGMACYAKDRGRSVTKVSQRTKTRLEKYFRPSNERFFSIIGKSFNW